MSKSNRKEELALGRSQPRSSGRAVPLSYSSFYYHYHHHNLPSSSSKLVWQGWRGTSLLSKRLFLDRIILHGMPSLPLSSPSLPLTCPLQLTPPLPRRRNGQKRACVYRLCRRPFFCSSFTPRYRIFPTSGHRLRLKRQHTARLSRQPP